MLNEKQLTFDAKGHFLNTAQCFSKDSNWIAYDTRNDDSKIGSTGSIEMVDVHDGKMVELYRTKNQSAYGPGVGAVSFSPTADQVIFIHGIRNADAQKPYDFTRRTGVAINIKRPNEPIFMDARDIKPPFTLGALRGGTHAHSWSGDGQWISFTYNDYIIAQQQGIEDLRTVGLMFPTKVEVDLTEDLENNNGEMFAVIISEVTQNPQLNSDEINKAFDECWIGKNGYVKPDGTLQQKAIAFQGNVMTKDGPKTEIFVVDLPNDLPKTAPANQHPVSSSERIEVPSGVAQRRITSLKNGVYGTRHWLRSSPDGSLIVFLAKDDEGYVNIFGVSPNGGSVQQISFGQFDVQCGPTFSPDGSQLAYIAEGHVYLTTIDTGASIRLTKAYEAQAQPVGCVAWSPDGKILAFNRYIFHQQAKKFYLQLFLLSL